MPDLPSRPLCHSRLSGSTDSGRRGSTAFSDRDDEDAITPCPLETTMPQEPAPYTPPNDRAQAPRPDSRRDSHCHFDPLDGEGDGTDPNALWRKMLAIQRAFGCYNSARMQAALELGGEDEDGFMPSKACLDFLNDSMSQLPDEVKCQVDEFLHQQQPDSRRGSTSSWKQGPRHG